MQIPIILTTALVILQSSGSSHAASAVVNFNLDFESTVDSFKTVLSSIKHALQVKSDVIRRLATQTMRDQVRQEERVRSEGDSGIVQVRSYQEGSKNYHSATAAEHSFAALYDIPLSKDAMTMGDAVIVMNGVEFRTHRVDYSLVMPSRTTSGFLESEPIPRSPVPPSVLQQPDVEGQINEMAEYFRAFKAQNSSHRDYQPYFKPVLCYLEGAWMADPADGDVPQNWYPVDKAYLGANTWAEAHDRQRTEAVTGTKDSAGRSAGLPSIITHIDAETGEPVYAQWNFRPMCQPLKDDLPTAYFRQIKDYAYAGERGIPIEQTFWAKGAHFALDELDTPGYGDGKLLEDFIRQVPGLDNGVANLNQSVFGNVVEQVWQERDSSTLNTGFYSHWYSFGYHAKRWSAPRGFSDRNLYVASTTQPSIANIPVTYCYNKRHCVEQDLRVSYMIPLEVIYTTPLASWNPRGVTDFGDDSKSYRAGGKNGRSDSRAYHGIYDKFFLQTPAEFFSGQTSFDGDSMDDNLRELWVLGSQGKPYKMEASGVRTIIPPITNDVGAVRTRYPIAPVHARGSAVWKELSAYIDSTA